MTNRYVVVGDDIVIRADQIVAIVPSGEGSDIYTQGGKIYVYAAPGELIKAWRDTLRPLLDDAGKDANDAAVAERVQSLVREAAAAREKIEGEKSPRPDYEKFDATLINLQAMARRVGTPAGWLKTEAASGRIPCLRAGRHMLFNPSAVEAALAARAATERLVEPGSQVTNKAAAAIRARSAPSSKMATDEREAIGNLMKAATAEERRRCGDYLRAANKDDCFAGYLDELLKGMANPHAEVFIALGIDASDPPSDLKKWLADQLADARKQERCRIVREIREMPDSYRRGGKDTPITPSAVADAVASNNPAPQ